MANGGKSPVKIAYVDQFLYHSVIVMLQHMYIELFRGVSFSGYHL